MTVPAAAESTGRFIYLAAPWSPAGGGMYKVADYLLQAQASSTPGHGAQLRPLDTRGPGSALASFPMLLLSLWKLLRGRMSGQLAGVHVNMAERLSLFRKASVVVACRALGIPVVIHLHAQMQRFYRSLPSPLRALVRWVFSLANTVVVIGSGPRKFVMEELKVPAKHIDIVINGVPGPEKAPVRTASATKHVVFVGRLCEPKGVTDLLQAVARADLDRAHVRVTLAGGGDVAGYEAKARALGVDDVVKFAGWFEQPQIDELLRTADVLVLPSHDEVMPLVVLEALANNVAVICTPVGELPTVLADNENAVFVPVGDVDALAAALHQVLGDPRLLARLAANGRDLYERQFSLSRFFTSIARVHQRHFGVCGHLPEAATAPKPPLVQEPLVEQELPAAQEAQ
jgi:glycosyltransferase involved in cell wall biosynthesis